MSPASTPHECEPGTLVRENGVKGRVYRDAELFQKELDRIWYKVWVYVGHESEVPQPGDYVRRQIGLQPVIMVRGTDDKVRVFYNRCRHRGNMLCLSDKGNAAKFTCPYHAWTYANTGPLIEPTFDEGYGDMKKENYGLTPLARQDSYRGLVFASVAEEGPSLKEHLGGIAEFIDLFIDLSPEGEILLDAGVQKVSYRGNWKCMPENSMEGDYHGPFIHKVAFDLYAKQTGFDVSELQTEDVPDVILSIPGGHMVEDYRGAPMAPRKGTPSPARLEYIRKMKERHGPEKASAMMSTMAPCSTCFPICFTSSPIFA
ncbi:aromatic ring-hydroxylating oxygenase subunit alpha [Bradyrhizobium sp. RDM4]|uniref:aromatic ring-hydroxylating oxygenase subunit alpha n=1 Tax=Bradyrhizobium sp. RDM4 TaxID=3378765 RepID=UPI0038FCD925